MALLALVTSSATRWRHLHCHIAYDCDIGIISWCWCWVVIFISHKPLVFRDTWTHNRSDHGDLDPINRQSQQKDIWYTDNILTITNLNSWRSLLTVVRLPCVAKRYMWCGSGWRKHPFLREYSVHGSTKARQITLDRVGQFWCDMSQTEIQMGPLSINQFGSRNLRTPVQALCNALKGFHYMIFLAVQKFRTAQ